jgi:hypothetical protein
MIGKIKIIIAVLTIFCLSFNPVFAANTKSIALVRASNQYAQITDAAQTGLEPAGNFSIEAWVKIAAWPVDNTWPIVIKGFRVEKVQYVLGIITSKKIRCWFADTAQNETVYVSNTFADTFLGGWHHIAVTVDVSASTMILYIDGVATTFNILSQNATSVGTGGQNFVIGGADNGDANYAFDGLIDEVRFWNDIRSEAEIQANYQTELASWDSSLVGYWKFNDSDLDETSNNNDLTLVNNPAYSTDVPFSGAVPVIKPDDGLMLFE